MPTLTLTLAVDATGARHRFDVLADSYKDLNPVLSELSKFKQAKIAELFASGGNGKWPDPKQRTEQRHYSAAIATARSAPETLRRKLEFETKRAQKRLDRLVERGVTTRTDKRGRIRDVQRSAKNAVARRAFVAEVFARRMGDLGSPSSTPEETRAVKGLGPRLQRAYGRAQKKPLGNLPQTIRASIKGGQLVIDSAWDSPAPTALNDGATVGGGARLEPRPFLFWEESDAEYFKLLLVERGLLAWGR